VKPALAIRHLASIEMKFLLRKRRVSYRENFHKNERNEEVEVFMRETMSEGAVKRRWLENDHARVKGAWNRNRR
jgi:hypothetical protein